MSGYGEASGNLVFKVDENLRKTIMSSKTISSETIDALFEHYDVNPELSKNMGFGINDRKALGEYIHLDIFDGSWIEIAKLLSKTQSKNTVVGEFWDDYGGAHFIASNGDGDSVNFFFEEESDEMDQDDFDEEAYYLEHDKNKEKWTAMIPKIAKGIFEE